MQPLLVLPLWIQSVYTGLVVIPLKVDGIKLVLNVDHLAEVFVLYANKASELSWHDILEDLLLHNLFLDLGLVVDELLMINLEAGKDTYVVD